MGFFKNGMIVKQVASIATSGGTTTLTATSKQIEVFTGTSTETVQLPDATTMALGQGFEIFNNSTGALTIHNHDGSSFSASPTVAAGISLVIELVNNGTANGTWSLQTGTATIPSITLSTQTTNYNLLSTDNVIVMNGSNLTLSLQAVSGATIKPYYISNQNATPLTINPNGSDTIIQSSTQTLSPGGGVILIPDGVSNWIAF